MNSNDKHVSAKFHIDQLPTPIYVDVSTETRTVLGGKLAEAAGGKL